VKFLSNPLVGAALGCGENGLAVVGVGTHSLLDAQNMQGNPEDVIAETVSGLI